MSTPTKPPRRPAHHQAPVALDAPPLDLTQEEKHLGKVARRSARAAPSLFCGLWQDIRNRARPLLIRARLRAGLFYARHRCSPCRAGCDRPPVACTTAVACSMARLPRR